MKHNLGRCLLQRVLLSKRALSVYGFVRDRCQKQIIISSLLYRNIDARSIQFLFKLSIAPFTEAGFRLALLFYLRLQKQPPELFYTKSCF